MWSLIRALRQRLAGNTPAPDLPSDLWDAVVLRVPHVAALGDSERRTLRALAARFLRDKAVHGAAGFEPEPWQAAAIAALACLPALRLGYGVLQGWHELIVYPGQFGVRRHDYDESTGVLTEWDDALAGEAWERGPLILSWADVEADLADPAAGYNVVLHEVAHKLDALDGAMNGTPALPRDQRTAWADDFQRAYTDLLARLERDEEPPIDAYAGEAPDEFFAVATEYHFSAPDVLAAAYPAVAAHLRRYYGPPPALPAPD